MIKLVKYQVEGVMGVLCCMISVIFIQLIGLVGKVYNYFVMKSMVVVK